MLAYLEITWKMVCWIAGMEPLPFPVYQIRWLVSFDCLIVKLLVYRIRSLVYWKARFLLYQIRCLPCLFGWWVGLPLLPLLVYRRRWLVCLLDSRILFEQLELVWVVWLLWLNGKTLVSFELGLVWLLLCCLKLPGFLLVRRLIFLNFR